MRVPTRSTKVPWTEKDVNKPKSKIIYLVSPMQRSGTNYLHYLLNLHPSISSLSDHDFPPEDFLLTHSDLLNSYVSKTNNLWEYWIKDKKKLHQQSTFLLKAIGNGIERSIQLPNNQYTLLKTPDALGIDNFFKLFPNSKLIILTRDGRDTIHSYMQSWGGFGNFKALAQRWNDRAQKILNFLDQCQNFGYIDQCYTMDYQDINSNTEDSIIKIFDFLEIDPALYDWQKMKSSPVLGSSELRGKKDKVNWQPIEKPKNFNEEAKWRSWSSKQKCIFKKYAGQSLIQLGYESDSDW